MKMNAHISAAALFLCLCLLLSGASLPSYADTKTEGIISERYTEPNDLPYKERLGFEHTADTEPKIRRISFRAEEFSPTSIVFKQTDTAAEDAKLSVSVYTDMAELVCEKTTDKSTAAHLQFVPSYTGTYTAEIISRASTAGAVSAEIEIFSFDDPKINTLSVFPHSAEYNLSSHRTEKVSKLYPDSIYGKKSEYVLSIFEISHTAGSIFTYTVNTKDETDVHAVFYKNDGGYFKNTSAHASDTYNAGDAQEINYGGTSFLFVYSKGSFTLECDYLLHLPYTQKELELPYSGNIDLSDASVMYDNDSVNGIIKRFPHSDIKNRNVIFFALKAEHNTVISLFCDRTEHTFFSIVSDKNGLSPSSVFPLQRAGGYCTELAPTRYCYDSVFSEDSVAYLCYTGTGASCHVELFSDSSHSAPTDFEERYYPASELPKVKFDFIYSGSSAYQKLGADVDMLDVRVIGYTFQGSDGDRYYAAHADSIQAPADRDSYSMYACVCYTFRYPWAERESFLLDLPIGEFTVARKIDIPIINEILDMIEQDPQKAAVTLGVPTLLIGSIAVGAVIFFAKRKNKKER